MPPNPPPDRVHARRRAMGERIRLRRRQAGLTQEGLAESVELDRKTISRVENGHRALLVDDLLRIADALAVDPALFVREL